MSAASATTPSSRMWRDSSASASSTAVVELVDAPRRVLDDDGIASLGEAFERGREREAVGPGVVQRVAHVVRDLRADELEQHGRRHRQAHPQHRLVRLLDGVAVIERLHDHRALPRRGGGSRRRPARRARARRVLRSFFVTAQTVASDASSVVRRARELDEREHGDRVEEVHPDDALGVLELRSHLGDGQRRRVRREHALGRDDALERREDLLLDAISSKTASSTRSQPAKTSHSVPPVTSEPRKRALPSPRRPRRTRSASSSRDPGDRVVDLLLRQVAEHDRHLESAEEEQRELSAP